MATITITRKSKRIETEIAEWARLRSGYWAKSDACYAIGHDIDGRLWKSYADECTVEIVKLEGRS